MTEYVIGVDYALEPDRYEVARLAAFEAVSRALLELPNTGLQRDPSPGLRAPPAGVWTPKRIQAVVEQAARTCLREYALTDVEVEGILMLAVVATEVNGVPLTRLDAYLRQVLHHSDCGGLG